MEIDNVLRLCVYKFHSIKDSHNVTFKTMKTANNLSHSEGKVQQNHMLRIKG